MGKVLTLRSGEAFYLDDDRYVVTQILGPSTAILARPHDGVAFTLSTDKKTDLAPRIAARLGTRGQNDLARVDVDAPKEVRIVPGADRRR
jgi:electron transfer flavoprotein alpha subunit